MKPISELIPSVSVPKKSGAANSERSELIGYFTDKINQRQHVQGKRTYNYGTIGARLAHLKKLEDLYYLKSICEHSDNWYQAFWGSIKSGDNRD